MTPDKVKDLEESLLEKEEIINAIQVEFQKLQLDAALLLKVKDKEIE
jgi:hypothetical protein